MTSIKRTPSGVAPAAQPSTASKPAAAASAPAPSKGWGAKSAAAPKQESGLSGFIHGLENKASSVINGAKTDLQKMLMKSMGPYPTDSQRAARTQQLDQAVAKMNLPPDQQKLLSTLKQAGANSVDLWQGSHMKFDDGGKLYDQLKSMPGAEARASSHYPGVKTQQYQLMVGNAPLLFGKDATGNTWMQMEGHPFHQKFDLDPKKLAAELGDDAAHLTDYAKYVALGKTQNIGPMGISPHSEHHDPLQIHYTGG
jgi:hypothetical protein